MTRPISEHALRECPFCGGEPRIGPDRGESESWVECSADDRCALVMGDNLADAIARWNRRAEPAPSREGEK